jgi:hypothetical protein
MSEKKRFNLDAIMDVMRIKYSAFELKFGPQYVWMRAKHRPIGFCFWRETGAVSLDTQQAELAREVAAERLIGAHRAEFEQLKREEESKALEAIKALFS